MSKAPTRDQDSTPSDRFEDDAARAIEEAVWAPSVHNTQPWRFSRTGDRISLRADADRRLDTADAGGREMFISCGAALLTLRIVLESLGYRPEVRPLPDPDRPHLLADVHLGVRGTGERYAREMADQIRRRHTHRGGFDDQAPPPALWSTLGDEAWREGADLRNVVDAHSQYGLAALTQAAHHVQSLTPGYVRELARWAPAPGNSRKDGVRPESYPREEVHIDPHFPGRDYARGMGWGVDPAADPNAITPMTGMVALLTTAADDPADWLRAGQALQRVLLRASGQGFSAAFHTQALELPELRDFIRTRFCAGRYPQMLLRLGLAVDEPATRRRPGDAVTIEEP